MAVPGASPKPSSATEGFFQPRPRLTNQYDDDVTYRRTLGFFLPKDIENAISKDLSRWGFHVLSPQVLRWNANAEAHPPVLTLRDSFGSPRPELVTSEGWRNLQDLGLREGIVATAYENEYGLHSRLVQFLKMFLWCGSSSTVTCPSAMQDGAAALIKRHLQNPSALDASNKAVLESAYARLTSRDPTVAWTSGQWMTERTGGSDVSGTETRARKLSETELKLESENGFKAIDGSALGHWSVDGFKWFSSATDADMTVLLAKTDASKRLSLFFAPVRRVRRTQEKAQKEDHSVEFNGVYPQRLKNKMGTKALPTAELELKGMRAYMLGKEGEGTKEISTVLNITRVYNAVSSVGAWGRGLGISRAFARVRRAAGGTLLTDIPAHVKGMADQHVQYRGNMMLTYFVVHLLGITEQKTAPEEKRLLQASWAPASRTQASQLLRLLTPVAKATTALDSIHGLRYCMESLGGLGYLENEDVELNIAKIFRDTNVLAIWEGTTDVMAADTVRVLAGRGGKDSMEALKSWVNGVLESSSVQTLGLKVEAVLTETNSLFDAVQTKESSELLYRGRDILQRLSWIVSTTLLIADASRDHDRITKTIAERWLAQKDTVLSQTLAGQNWKERAKLDREIVFGSDGPSSAPRL